MSQRLHQLQTLLTDSPDDEFLLFAIAKEYENLGDNALALQYYLSLKQLSPNYIGLYYHLGKLQEQLDQPTQALATYADGVARAHALDDQHARAELQSAKLNLEMEL